MNLHKKTKRYMKLAGICTIILLIYTATHMTKRSKEISSIFFIQKNIFTGDTQNKQIQKMQNTKAAYVYLQRGQYQKALELITGKTFEEYYNRGIIKTQRAYTQALTTGYTQLTHAQELIHSAQKDFDIAQRLAETRHKKTYIIQNLKEIKKADVVIQSKTCYIGTQKGIVLLSGLLEKLEQTKFILKKEYTTFQSKKSQLPYECQTQRENLFSRSNTNLQIVQQASSLQKIKETEDLKRKVANPILCTSGTKKDLIQSLEKAQHTINIFIQQHQENIQQRQKPIEENKFCNQEKNDNTINDTLEDTLQKLLSEFSIEKKPNKTQTQSQPSYNPLNTQEQKLLENINKKNKIWIRQIQRLRTEKEYQGFEYIKSLFTNFYGNSGDFVSSP